MTILGMCMLLIGSTFPPEAQGRRVCEINGVETTHDTTILFELPERIKTAKQLSKWMQGAKRSFQCATVMPDHPRMVCLDGLWGLDVDQSPLSIQMMRNDEGFYINVTDD